MLSSCTVSCFTECLHQGLLTIYNDLYTHLYNVIVRNLITFDNQFCVHTIISGVGLPGVGEEEFLSDIEELKQCLAARTSLDEVNMS